MSQSQVQTTLRMRILPKSVHKQSTTVVYTYSFVSISPILSEVFTTALSASSAVIQSRGVKGRDNQFIMLTSHILFFCLYLFISNRISQLCTSFIELAPLQRGQISPHKELKCSDIYHTFLKAQIAAICHICYSASCLGLRASMYNYTAHSSPCNQSTQPCCLGFFLLGWQT